MSMWQRLFGDASEQFAEIGNGTGRALERLEVGQDVKEKIDRWIADVSRLRDTQPIEAIKAAAKIDAGIEILTLLKDRGEKALRR